MIISAPHERGGTAQPDVHGTTENHRTSVCYPLSPWRRSAAGVAETTRKIGKGRKLKDGKEIAILSLRASNFAAAAIRDLKREGFQPAHYDYVLP